MWLTIIGIIFSIIQAIPQIEAVIKEILAMLHHQPAQHGAFLALLAAHEANPAAAGDALKAFHATLKAAQP